VQPSPVGTPWQHCPHLRETSHVWTLIGQLSFPPAILPQRPKQVHCSLQNKHGLVTNSLSLHERVPFLGVRTVLLEKYPSICWGSPTCSGKMFSSLSPYGPNSNANIAFKPFLLPSFLPDVQVSRFMTIARLNINTSIFSRFRMMNVFW
jgi:hypothetical protein